MLYVYNVFVNDYNLFICNKQLMSDINHSCNHIT